MNTLDTLEPGNIYTFFAEERGDEPEVPAGDPPTPPAPADDDGDAPADDDGDAPADDDGDAPADDGEDEPADDGEDEPADDDEPAVAPNPQLERELVADGSAFVRWEGESTSVAEAVAGLTLRVTSIRFWDKAGQFWRVWTPGGAANTLDTFEPDNIYTILAEAR